MKNIICKDLCINYENTIALSDLSFTVNRGDYLCILGENGAGKSTLIKALLGLIKPSRGEIIYNGIDRRHIGYLAQSCPIPKGFPSSCLEVVMSGYTSLFHSKKEYGRAHKNMEILGVTDIKNRCFSELSGGQKQRVLLARALCAAEDFLFLDEPVSGLDPVASSQMYELIEKLNREHNMTVIMISHDTESAAKYATHILHLKGKDAFFGTTEEYMKTALSREFLGGCGHAHH